MKNVRQHAERPSLGMESTFTGLSCCTSYPLVALWVAHGYATAHPTVSRQVRCSLKRLIVRFLTIHCIIFMNVTADVVHICSGRRSTQPPKNG
jgi:hypothetical protein